jgi:hypothetical protein
MPPRGWLAAPIRCVPPPSRYVGPCNNRCRSRLPIFSFTSKYAPALYELITARINLTHVWKEEVSVDDLRAILGVKMAVLTRVPNLLQRVIEPAMLEVNGLADLGLR